MSAARPELAQLLRDAGDRLDRGELDAVALVTGAPQEKIVKLLWNRTDKSNSKALAVGLALLAETILVKIKAA